MTNPYSVPLEDLDAVHVDGEELVQEQPLRWAGAGALPGLAFPDGMGGGGGQGDGD